METPLVLFLMSFSLYLFINDRLMRLSIVGFLLFLGRIDTGLWLLALAVDLFLSHRKKGIGKLICPLVFFCGFVAALLAFLKFYFWGIYLNPALARPAVMAPSCFP